MLIYMAVAVASAMRAPEGILASFTILKLFQSYILYWCVVNCIRTGIPVRAVWRGLIGVAFITIFEVLRQKYMLGIYRVPGTFDHSNTLAMYLNMLMGLVLAMGLSDRGLGSVKTSITLVAALGMLLSTVMTFSRAGMALGAFCVMGVLVYANLRTRNIRVAVSTLVAFGGLLVGSAMVAPSIIDRFMQAPPASEHARDEFNEAARRMLTDHPFGIGINHFSRVMTDTPRYRSHITVMYNEEQAGVCHHIYWLTAAEMGWIGLVAFVVIILRFASRALWFAWRTPGRDGLLQAGLFLGMVATHASGFFEWVFRITPLFFTFLVCCGISIGLAEKEKMRRRALPASVSEQQEDAS